MPYQTINLSKGLSNGTNNNQQINQPLRALFARGGRFSGSYRLFILHDDLHHGVDVGLGSVVVHQLDDIGGIYLLVAVGVALVEDIKGRSAADGIVATLIVCDGHGGRTDSSIVAVADGVLCVRNDGRAVLHGDGRCLRRAVIDIARLA